MAHPRIAILGASGLIGHAVALGLLAQGRTVLAVARRFTSAQSVALGDAACEVPMIGLSDPELAEILSGADVVVNCVGVLQDSMRGDTGDVHTGFVGRLAHVLAGRASPALLIQISIPGDDEADATAFARTKRAAERIIVENGLPHVILRPGFVIANAAYGGSALIRALVALPVGLSATEMARPFQTTDVDDITRTVAQAADAWASGRRDWSESWDVMSPEPTTLGGVVEAFRRHLGGPRPLMSLPSWCLNIGVRLGDLAARLGWAPPVRSTALAELRRGVSGDPMPWSTATGIQPARLGMALSRRPSTVQDHWFVRLYLLKPLTIVVLALFWTVSGLIALFPAFDQATAILTDHGFSRPLAVAVTVVSSLIDIFIGIAIALRCTCRPGLWLGIAVSLFYMAGAAVITPDMWIEPLGALVKTGPAIILMLIALVTLDDR